MKYLMLVLLILSLSGCLYQRVDISDLKEAKEFCEKNNSEVLYVDISFSGREITTCVNGTWLVLHEGR